MTTKDTEQSLSASFRSLSNSPKELYIVFILQFLDTFGYFAVSQLLVIYLHKEFGFSDVEAGFLYGLWGLSTTFWGLMTASTNDSLGVRKALMTGFLMSTFAAFIIATTSSKIIIYFSFLVLQPLGTCLGSPMLTVGIKRYTTPKNRGFAFGLFYSVMNIAAFVSGPIVDAYNLRSNTNPNFSGNRKVILTTTITYFTAFLVTWLSLREIKVDENEIKIDSVGSTMESIEVINNNNNNSKNNDTIEMKSVNNSDYSEVELGDTISPIISSSVTVISDANNNNDNNNSNYDNTNNSNEITQAFVPTKQNICISSSELFKSKTFWRYVLFSLFLINLRTIFRHLDATFPTYLIRSFGPNYPKGTIYSINPFIIMLLTPIVAAFTTNAAHFDMIKYGGYFTAISPFFLAFSTSTWAVVCFMIVLSLGEAVWSPRTYDYTMSIAPEGKEATFSALASAPLFVAKVPVGLLSGYLLKTYLPENKSKSDGKTLWLIIGLLTISSPILITLFEPIIREPAKINNNRSNNNDHNNHNNNWERCNTEEGNVNNDSIPGIVNDEISTIPSNEHNNNDNNDKSESSTLSYSDTFFAIMRPSRRQRKPLEYHQIISNYNPADAIDDL
eukprot:gene10101-13577_t